MLVMLPFVAGSSENRIKEVEFQLQEGVFSIPFSSVEFSIQAWILCPFVVLIYQD